jgi:hypothetical protein
MCMRTEIYVSWYPYTNESEKYIITSTAGFQYTDTLVEM